MDKLEFCRRCVHLNRELIRFERRPYLPAIYASQARNLVLKCSRQTEKSTFLVNTIVYEACTRPGIQILFVSPRMEQAQVFSKSRLLPVLEQSPLIRRRLLGKRPRRPQVLNMQFANGSALHVRAAFHSGDAARGLSASLLLVDEFQDVAEGDLPVLQETLSHTPGARTLLTGTPKSIDNHLDSMFRQSTAHEWSIECTGCQKLVILDEHSLGPTSLVCPRCQLPVDPANGRWVARHPNATWGDGFWISHLMVPWLQHHDILERQRTYDFAKFKNEVLGLATTTGDHIVTRAELEACCTTTPFAKSVADIPLAYRKSLVAGLDWGGGGASRTVLVIGFMDTQFRFHICYMERFARSEDPQSLPKAVCQRCHKFRVSFIAADGGGNGHVYNRLLVDELRQQLPLYAVLYSASEHSPTRDGVLHKWTVHRSASIGALFTRVKKQTVVFPRVEECGSFLDEFACETAEYDDVTRTVKYSHPESQQDDALHATNYALLLAARAYNAASAHWK